MSVFRVWAVEALKRAGWTMLAVAVPYVPFLIAVDTSLADWVNAFAVVSFAGFFSVLTAAVQLPAEGSLSPWVAVLLRGVRTFAQSLLAFVTVESVWGDLSWGVVVQAVAATVVSLLRSYLMALPEEQRP